MAIKRKNNQLFIFKIGPVNHQEISIFLLILILFIISFSSPIYASKSNSFSYFASLRSSETNVRSGPGRLYPIKFTYKIKNIPILITDEYDNWNEIKDYEGQTGWINKSLITKKRSLMIRTSKSFAKMYKSNNNKSKVIYKLENNVIGDYIECVKNWCKIEIEGKKGWVEKNDLFGF